MLVALPFNRSIKEVLNSWHPTAHEMRNEVTEQTADESSNGWLKDQESNVEERVQIDIHQCERIARQAVFGQKEKQRERCGV